MTELDETKDKLNKSKDDINEKEKCINEIKEIKEKFAQQKVREAELKDKLKEKNNDINELKKIIGKSNKLLDRYEEKIKGTFNELEKKELIMIIMKNLYNQFKDKTRNR